MVRILAFSGSTREASFNKKLVRIAAEGARAASADVTELDLREVPMPLYDADVMERDGFPEGAVRFKQMLVDHDALLISTPEYNYGIPAVLKNAIDWASRRDGDEPPLVSFRGLVAAVLSASPGIYGGARAILHLRSVLTGCKILVIPDQLSLTMARKAFDGEGRLTVPEVEAEVLGIGRRLADIAAKLSG